MIEIVTILFLQLCVYIVANWIGRNTFRSEISRQEMVSPNVDKTPTVVINISLQQTGSNTQEPDPAIATPYRKELTKSQLEFNKKLMGEYIEKFPHSPFHEKNPEFMEDYLNRIDLSELGFDVQKD